ncbi:MAG: glycosyl hydrolase family 28-related protein, partial [Chitinophagaceae bacterium]
MKYYLPFWLAFVICLPVKNSGSALRKASSSLPFPLLALPANSDIWFNVKDYGAKADGKTNDAAAINKAIDAAAAAGGGTVFFPAGTYLSGSIRLKSNITLYLSSGTVLEAIDDT